ncbi:DNA-binding protein 1 [Trabala vishnou gigantina nucleopolyhedrovirus]|uniref:DNA-binding protein 1 n=1 Tax=Trabala vishnou gigantina nucleopolyhedrovirus TaxID=2863583 RepID=UPI002481ED15|nr:DNA-binding protein 1 [Trabala vishnou gigantina nucleopolyhedrovirus]QYC92713.1 DNA-binding protein 1 [Trabala vishnou gigantina nucleopolyhedrovirus]
MICENDCYYFPTCPNNDKRTLTWKELFLKKLRSTSSPLSWIICNNASSGHLYTLLNNLKRYNDRFDCLTNRLQVVCPFKKYNVYCVKNRINLATAPRCVYVFEKIVLVTRVNSAGEFFSITWPNIHNTIDMYKKALADHLKIPEMIINDFVYANAPNRLSLCAKTTFARSVFRIKRASNEVIYNTGQLTNDKGDGGGDDGGGGGGGSFSAPLVVEPMTANEYDALFPVNRSVELIMGAIIEGVKECKSEIELHNANNKVTKTKTFSLAIKPMIYFHME